MPHIAIDGIRTYYHAPRDLSEARGQRVLYVHGTGCNGRVWEEHMRAIADAHTPVAIDLPGHGQSGGRGFRGVGDYAHFTVELGRALGWSRFVVVGHSMGGAIAITIALYHAELLAGLALVDTGARLRVGPDILKASRAAAESGRAVPTDRSWGYAPSTPPSVVDSVNALTAGTDPRVTYADWIADDMFDTMARVKDITVPTLVLCGAEDRLTPIRNHRYLQEHIRGSQLTVIDRAGHWVFHEQPEAFTRAMRGFLDSLPIPVTA